MVRQSVERTISDIDCKHTPETSISTISAPIDAIFLDISHILLEGSLNINHRKQLAERFGKDITSNTKTTKVKVKKARGRPKYQLQWKIVVPYSLRGLLNGS